MSDAYTQLTQGKQKLIEDFRTLLSDSQEMLRLSMDRVGPAGDALRAGLQTRIAATQKMLASLQDDAQIQMQRATRGTDEYVRENPWRAVGFGLAAGLLLGVLAAR